MNLYDDWIQAARQSGTDLVFLPLDETYRAKFNKTKALEWFKPREGLPYGSENVVFSFIDTPNNLFYPFTGDSYAVILRLASEDNDIWENYFR